MRIARNRRRYDRYSLIVRVFAYFTLRLNHQRSSLLGIASLEPCCYIRREPTTREWAPSLARSIASIPQALFRE